MAPMPVGATVAHVAVAQTSDRGVALVTGTRASLAGEMGTLRRRRIAAGLGRRRSLLL